jgi:hypothetical protein
MSDSSIAGAPYIEVVIEVIFHALVLWQLCNALLRMMA